MDLYDYLAPTKSSLFANFAFDEDNQRVVLPIISSTAVNFGYAVNFLIFNISGK